MLKYTGAWALGLVATVGVLRLMGPTTGEGPEAIVMRALANGGDASTNEDKQNRRAERVAAYEELAIQGTAATSDEEIARVLAAAREMYASDPEAFWIAFDKWAKHVPLKKQIGFLVNFSGYANEKVGAVVAMDFLERGYVKAGDEDPDGLTVLIEQAAIEDPERCVRWLENQSGGDLDQYTLLMAPRLLDSDSRRQVEQRGIPMTEARHQDYAVRDLLDMIPDRINSENFGGELGEQLSRWPEGEPIKLGSMVTAMLSGSDDLHATLNQLNQLPGDWRSRVMTSMVGQWAARDVVTASQALSQLDSIPDAAIESLVREIAGDQEAAILWTNQIQDPALREHMLRARTGEGEDP